MRLTSRALRILARIGYGTIGIVYILVAVLAAQVAIGERRAPGGTHGAVSLLADQPFGRVLLWAACGGLAAYVVWLIVAAIVDAEDRGHGVTGIIDRAGYVFTGLFYGGLAYAAGWAAAMHGRLPVKDGQTEMETTRTILAQPFGQFLVGAGAIIFGVIGLIQIVRAVRGTFMEEYGRKLGEKQRAFILRFGRVGLSARGISFLIIAALLGRAAIDSDATQSRGLAGALQSLAQQTHGTLMLATMSFGMLCYGVYCFARARYRQF